MNETGGKWWRIAAKLMQNGRTWKKVEENGIKSKKIKSLFRKWGKVLVPLGNGAKWEKMERNEEKWNNGKLLDAVPLADRVGTTF